MAYKSEKVVTPERVVLRDGRQGYFITAPVATGAVVVIKYPKKKPTGKATPSKKIRASSVGKSIIKALKEVKARKKTNSYPAKGFDALMDEL